MAIILCSLIGFVFTYGSANHMGSALLVSQERVVSTAVMHHSTTMQNYPDDMLRFSPLIDTIGVDPEDTVQTLDDIANVILGKYTVAEHYIPARITAELIYYHGNIILPEDWWLKHRLLLSVAVGFGLGIFINEVWEYYWFPSEHAAFASALDRLRRDPDTHTDMLLGTINLTLFAFEKMFPPFEGVIIIETHSPIMAGRLNPFTSCGWREEVIFTSKYLAFSYFQIGVAFGHGQRVSLEQASRGYNPTWFNRVFRPRRVGLELSPGGPPIYGSYTGIAMQYNHKIGKIPFMLTFIPFTSTKRKLGFRLGLTVALDY